MQTNEGRYKAALEKIRDQDMTLSAAESTANEALNPPPPPHYADEGDVFEKGGGHYLFAQVDASKFKLIGLTYGVGNRLTDVCYKRGDELTGFKYIGNRLEGIKKAVHNV